MKYRPAAMAGSFYPEDKVPLQQMVTAFLASEQKPMQQARALIVPHAGYIYSGAIAGLAFANLTPYVNNIKRVIILGPNHREPLLGCALSSADYFQTPLGKLTLDQVTQNRLATLDFVEFADYVHQLEHSIEVQLPFIQMLFTDITIIPIVVGQCSADKVNKLLQELALTQQDLLVISSDLSHFHEYQQAQRIDQNSCANILHFASTINGQQACGANAINGLLRYAKTANWQITLIKNINSGDTAGDKQRVVGYGSFKLY
ncbi:AmmeMemoRadiSam system protein B [Psychromonas sp. MME2]|uniref:AmmeMemoRadiSam system protein B n=1 Tax=unclassified Psychromonas TaxID=2614957 RepID=UPI00339C9296